MDFSLANESTVQQPNLLFIVILVFAVVFMNQLTESLLLCQGAWAKIVVNIFLFANRGLSKDT